MQIVPYLDSKTVHIQYQGQQFHDDYQSQCQSCTLSWFKDSVQTRGSSFYITKAKVKLYLISIQRKCTGTAVSPVKPGSYFLQMRVRMRSEVWRQKDVFSCECFAGVEHSSTIANYSLQIVDVKVRFAFVGRMNWGLIRKFNQRSRLHLILIHRE